MKAFWGNLRYLVLLYLIFLFAHYSLQQNVRNRGGNHTFGRHS